MDIFETIRKGLAQRIKMAGYKSFELFAHEHSLSKSTLSLILNGKREPKISTLVKIANALETDVQSLLCIPNQVEKVEDSKKDLKKKESVRKKTKKK